MANIVKTKFTGLLRGLLRRFDDGDSPMPELSRHSHQTTPSSSVPERPSSSTFPQRAASSASMPSNTNPDELELPLLPILSTLPMDLRAKVIQAPPQGTTLVMPIEKVLSQLAHGSVKISFGELRMAAPGIFVNSGGENDSRPVTLPLNDILSRLNPSLLAKRSTQKRIEVSEEIAGPFGANAHGISFTTAPLKSAPVTPPRPQYPDQVAEKLFTPPSAPASPQQPAFVPRATAASVPFASPVAPKNGNGNGNGNSIPDVFATTRNFPAAPTPTAAAQSQPLIFVQLGELIESWPEGLKMEITQLNLSGAQIALPVAVIEPGLKRGRVAFTWKNLRALIKPNPPGVSVHDGIELDLPLKVIAPLFFSHSKMAKPQKKLSVAEEIPNLFFGFPQPQSQPEPVVSRPAPALPKPTATPLPPTRPAAAQPPRSDTDIFFRKKAEAPAPEIAPVEFKRPVAAPATDFLSRFATPQQIIDSAMEIPGVAGAVVALPDGLKVAGEVPANLNGDTIAAFLPQLISRVNQASRELRMGDLNHLSFTVGMVQWEIFRVNGVFLAVFSDMNELLPSAQLAQLAAQLERKK